MEYDFITIRTRLLREAIQSEAGESVADRVLDRVRAHLRRLASITEEEFVAEHGLAPVCARAAEIARDVFGNALVGLRSELDYDYETSEPFLLLRIQIDVPRESYTPLQDEFLTRFYGEHENLEHDVFLCHVGSCGDA